MTRGSGQRQASTCQDLISRRRQFVCAARRRRKRVSPLQSLDFLADAPPTQFDWLFEHTLFCAIDPSRRDDYVKAVLRWLKPGGQFLAIHYMIRDEQGPPFGVTQEELMERFLPHFELKQGWVPRSYANRTGLELKLWWQRK